MSIIRNSNVYLENRGIVKTSLRIENGVIAEISDEIEGSNTITLPEKQILVPGFIDEHTHGADGSDAMDASSNSLHTIAKAILEEGTTSLLFTTMTMTKKSISSALSTIREYLLSQDKSVANGLGIHLEGPFISPAFCGAQNKEDILELSVDDLNDFIRESGDNIKEMTFSYKAGHDDFIKLAHDHHIVLSLGHTDDTYQEAKEAFDKGVRLTTHTYNAMRGFHHREAGTVGALFMDDRVSCELILDLHHVCRESAEILYRMKGKDHIILITDSMEAKYLKDGQYELGGNPVYVKDGTARLKDGTLAGSILKMNDAIRNAKDVFSISLTDAIDLATINPARNLHVDNMIGSIALGKRADFALIDENINVYKTFRNGVCVYNKKGE